MRERKKEGGEKGGGEEEKRVLEQKRGADVRVCVCVCVCARVRACPKEGGITNQRLIKTKQQGY